jgi:hypothetical protein
MSVIFNKKENTTTIHLESQDLIVFIDESGSEKLSDKNNPFFVVAGFCCDVKTFLKDLDTSWKNLKKDHLGTHEKNLHASKIDIKNTKLIADISNFFQNNLFARFAFSYGDRTYNKVPFKHAQIVASDIATAIIEFNLEKYRSKQVYVFAEKFTKGSYQYLEYLEEAFKIISETEKSDHLFNLKIFHINKSYLLCGNEIADFICHAAGRQAKKYNEGITELGKDYISVFQSIDKSFIKCFHSIGYHETSMNK